MQSELNAPSKVIRCGHEASPVLDAARLSECIPMDETQFAVVQSIYTLGGLIGALITGPLATRYGRLLTMRLTTIVFILGPAAESLASNIPIMIVGRLLSGVGAGASTVVCPICCGDITT